MDAEGDLLERAAGGDRAAVTALYRRYAPVLLGIAVRIVRTQAEAEDVLHDLFVSLPARARHYSRERGTVTAWLVILTRNLCIDRIRRRAGLARAADALEAPAPVPTPESLAGATSRRQRILRALEALPPVQRATLEAAFFEGLTYSELAEREGVALGTIKSRCARSMAVLREVLAGDGLSLDDLDGGG